jgi:hypothetical protein
MNAMIHMFVNEKGNIEYDSDEANSNRVHTTVAQILRRR